MVSKLRIMLLLLLLCGLMVRSSNAVCAFNPCDFGDMCPEKTCVLLDNCMISCECDVTSTASDCTNMTSSPLDTTESTVGWTNNGSECLCVHGNCSTSDSNDCICDEGWSGDLCELECLLNCDPGFKCEIIQSPFRFSICSPIKISTTPAALNDTSPPVDIEPGLRVYNACRDDYTIRNISETMCDSGWFCIKGVCKSNGTRQWCECDIGATGPVCNDRCCKTCVHGECFYDILSKEEMCNCYMNYSGAECDIWDPPGTKVSAHAEPTWPYWVVGSCSFVLLLLICLVIIVPYILWKHRVILVMKVVHYFQEYEDDDEREWDVFISYRSTASDESFVVDTLFPKLEKVLGFKVNVHFRDFVAGETISNNIISAVQGSRRTILIITPAYVTSEFTKFEYQVAQQEMIKRKHRIIPILLEDISDCKETMDPMLKIILGSVTYIEWPKIDNEKKLEKFWKRIELSMPKKKARSVESTHTPLTNDDFKSSKPNNPDTTSSKTISQKNGVTDGNIYTVIDESKINDEEVYDTLNESEMLTQVMRREDVYDSLNESEMLTQVMRRQNETEKKSKQDEFLNVLKIDL